ncbi:hypothetical protein FACS1894186_3810 [Alphaproteobacteria bacterium]|nr:hypothetical protein FACS1894186_3810 [Alphaproteobacteria bacterium]
MSKAEDRRKQEMKQREAERLRAEREREKNDPEYARQKRLAQAKRILGFDDNGDTFADKVAATAANPKVMDIITGKAPLRNHPLARKVAVILALGGSCLSGLVNMPDVAGAVQALARGDTEAAKVFFTNSAGLGAAYASEDYRNLRQYGPQSKFSKKWNGEDYIGLNNYYSVPLTKKEGEKLVKINIANQLEEIKKLHELGKTDPVKGITLEGARLAAADAFMEGDTHMDKGFWYAYNVIHKGKKVVQEGFTSANPILMQLHESITDASVKEACGHLMELYHAEWCKLKFFEANRLLNMSDKELDGIAKYRDAVRKLKPDYKFDLDWERDKNGNTEVFFRDLKPGGNPRDGDASERDEQGRMILTNANIEGHTRNRAEEVREQLLWLSSYFDNPENFKAFAESEIPIELKVAAIPYKDSRGTGGPAILGADNVIRALDEQALRTLYGEIIPEFANSGAKIGDIGEVMFLGRNRKGRVAHLVIEKGKAGGITTVNPNSHIFLDDTITVDGKKEPNKDYFRNLDRRYGEAGYKGNGQAAAPAPTAVVSADAVNKLPAPPAGNAAKPTEAAKPAKAPEAAKPTEQAEAPAPAKSGKGSLEVSEIFRANQNQK